MIAAIMLATQLAIDQSFLEKYAKANIVERSELIDSYANKCSLHILVEGMFRESVSGLRSEFSFTLGRLPSTGRDRLIMSSAGHRPLGYRASDIFHALTWPSKEAKEWIFTRLVREGRDWSFETNFVAIATIMTSGTAADEERLSSLVDMREFQGAVRRGRYWSKRRPKALRNQ